MFNLNIDRRLSAWADLRKSIDVSEHPLQTLVDFWSQVPFNPGKPIIDPFYPNGWPTPWEILAENKYDDFTKAVMMGYTLLLTDRYKNSSVQVKTLVDNAKNQLYNAVYLDDLWVLNFKDGEVVSVDHIPESCILENLVELKKPR